MALTASWTTGATTLAWRARTREPGVVSMPHASREILRVAVPDLDVERTEIYLAVVPTGYVPDAVDWRAAVYTDGVAMLLYTATDPAGLHAVWVRIRSGIETVLRVAATLVIEPGPDGSGLPPLDPNAGRMPARIPAYLGDPTGRTVVEGGAGMPALIPSRIGAGQPDPPDPGTGPGAGMPAQMPARIGEDQNQPDTGTTTEGPGAMPSAMPASLT